MAKQDSISNSDDTIDSRSINERIEQLTEEFTVDLEDADDVKRMAGFDYEEVEELAKLIALRDEAKGYCPDWDHGATLINEEYFEKYAQELAQDTGSLNRETSWPFTHIDWESAADELKQDYTAVDFDGTTYYVR